MLIDAAYCYRPSSTVCRSVTVLSPVKTAESIEMLFGLRTQVGRRNHVSDGVCAHCKVQALSAISCAKTAELIEMLFDMLSWVDPRNHILDGV